MQEDSTLKYISITKLRNNGKHGKTNDFQDLPLPDLLLGNCKQKKRKDDINSFAFVTNTFRKGYINRRNPNKCEKKIKIKNRGYIHV